MSGYEELGFFDFEDFVEELNEEELFCLNGGACGAGSSSSYTPHYSGSCAGGGTATPSMPSVPTCGGGYSQNQTCGGGYKNNNTLSDQDDDARTPDAVDRTNNEYVKRVLEQNGFSLLSNEKDDTYQADGSERKYFQSLFEMFKSDSNFKIVTKEAAIEGNVSAGFGKEDYTEYIIFADNKIVYDGIDVNNDGEIDYAKK